MSRRVGLAALLLPLLAGAQTLPGSGTQPGGLDGQVEINDPVVCQVCHDWNATDDATLYMPYDGWVSSMMGNSARDPLFLAALTVANQDKPGSGQFCLRCHSPQSYVRGHSLPADGSAFDAVDRAGVQCEVCHRSTGNPDGGPPLIGNAQLFFDPTATKRGPYADAHSPNHETAADPFIGSSELCGQCHQVLNPFSTWRKADGGDSGLPFPLDTTYEEWKQSAFARAGPDARSCQGCHLPPYPGKHVVARNGVERTDPPRHLLVGGNVWGVKAVLAANPQLADYADSFAETEAATLRLLQTAARVELTVNPGPFPLGAVVPVQVRVTNLSGHKLPTGYADGRRAFLELSVNGQVVTGRYDADAGLVEDPQLRVYEAVHGKYGVGPEEHLALHDVVVKDSRIPPAGFVATPMTAVVGTRWFDEGDGGVRDHDDAVFQLTLPSSGEAATVTARLLYQSTTPQYVDFLASENHTDGRGAALKEVYAKTGRGAPVELAKAEASVALLTPTTEAPSGCTCRAGAGGSAGWVTVLLAGVALTRRRRSRSRGVGP